MSSFVLEDDATPIATGGLLGMPGRAVAWLAAAFLAEQARWALWLPVFVGTGIGIYFALKAEPPWWLGLAGMAATMLAGALGRRSGTALLLAAGLFAGMLGFAAAQLSTGLAAAPILPRALGPVMLEGRVLSDDPMQAGARLVIAPSSLGDLPAGRIPTHVRIHLRRPAPDLMPGMWVRVRVMLVPPPGPAMPGAYDFQRAAYFAGLGAVGYGLGAATVIEGPAGEAPGRVAVLLNRWRRTITTRIRATLPEPSASIAAAIITGERGGIPDEISEEYRDSGLVHLLVIAGVHMSLAAGVAFFGLRALLALIPPLALRYPIQKWAAAAAMLLLVGYLLISGHSVSSERAFIMRGLVVGAVLFDRRSLSIRTVALAATFLLLATPESLFGATFQLSFGAVVGLVAFYETVRGRLTLHGRGPLKIVVGFLLATAVTSAIATLSTAPFSIYSFGRFQTYAVPANIIAMPVAGLMIMPGAVLACLAMPFGLEAIPLRVMGAGIDIVDRVAGIASHWPGAVIGVPRLPLWGLLLITAGALWLIIWQRRWRLAGLAPILLGLCSLLLDRPPDVLVSGDGKMMAVRDAGGAYLLSTSHGDRFTADVWRRRVGNLPAGLWPEEGRSEDGRLTCDPLGCLYRAEGASIALVRLPAALAEDCRMNAVVVSPIPAPWRCREQTHLVDRFDLWREGATAIWAGPTPVVESVADDRGDRPWTPHRPPRFERRAVNNGGRAQPSVPAP